MDENLFVICIIILMGPCKDMYKIMTISIKYIISYPKRSLQPIFFVLIFKTSPSKLSLTSLRSEFISRDPENQWSL